MSITSKHTYTCKTVSYRRLPDSESSFIERRAIYVNSDYIEEAKNFIVKNGVNDILISPYHGFIEGNLNFILDIKKLKGVDIFVASNVDISAVEKCTDLEYLRISDSKQKIDLSYLSNLEWLVLGWHKKMKLPLPDNSRLKYLWIYRPADKTLQFLPHYRDLASIYMLGGSTVALDGVERFKNLRKYTHEFCKNLHDISKLTELSRLEHLRLDLCRKIEVGDIFERCKKLKTLAYLRCPDLPSLAFINKMKELEWLVLADVNVLDGDMTPLLKLKHFEFYPSKRHYSHTCEELKKIHANQ